MKNKKMLKKKYDIPKDSFLVGSFQRDTEGKDLTIKFSYINVVDCTHNDLTF